MEQGFERLGQVMTTLNSVPRSQNSPAQASAPDPAQHHTINCPSMKRVKTVTRKLKNVQSGLAATSTPDGIMPISVQPTSTVVKPIALIPIIAQIGQELPHDAVTATVSLMLSCSIKIRGPTNCFALFLLCWP